MSERLESPQKLEFLLIPTNQMSTLCSIIGNWRVRSGKGIGTRKDNERSKRTPIENLGYIRTKKFQQQFIYDYSSAGGIDQIAPLLKEQYDKLSINYGIPEVSISQIETASPFRKVEKDIGISRLSRTEFASLKWNACTIRGEQFYKNKMANGYNPHQEVHSMLQKFKEHLELDPSKANRWKGGALICANEQKHNHMKLLEITQGKDWIFIISEAEAKTLVRDYKFEFD